MRTIFIKLLCSILIAGMICPSSLVFAAEKKEDYSALWPKAPSVNAESAILMDLSTGLILYEKNSHKKEYPASITKIMTTLLAIENCDLNEIVTFSHDAIFGIEAGSSHIAIDVGEQLTVEQCLYAIMLPSANEVSWGIGEHISGTISKFSKLMNQRAKELGCTNTHFVNANGLHDDDHYTCAYDMALISREAMKHEQFRKVTATKTYSIPPTNKHKQDNVFPNHHQMLNAYRYPQYEYEYCIGGKTGYTHKAGNTLVTFASKNGIDLVCVVMRANGPTSPKNEYTDTTSLFNFAFENYKQYNITDDSVVQLEEDSPLFTTYSPFFSLTDSPLQLGSNATILLPNTAKLSEAERSIEFYNDIKLQEGENKIGKISYTYGGKTVGSTDILFTKDSNVGLTITSQPKETKKKEVKTSGKMNLKPFIIAGIIFVIVFCIWLYFHLTWRKKRRRRKYNIKF